jgi:hypothetical protein
MSPGQLSLPLARNSDPRTSHEAARRAPNGEDVILVVFAEHPHGLTDDELCSHMAEHYPPTIKSARSRLSKYGCVFDAGKRRVSLRNRSMIVWTMFRPEVEVVKVRGGRL